jgi:cytochrome c biogenesis protein CcdA
MKKYFLMGIMVTLFFVFASTGALADVDDVLSDISEETNKINAYVYGAIAFFSILTLGIMAIRQHFVDGKVDWMGFIKPVCIIMLLCIMIGFINGTLKEKMLNVASESKIEAGW